MPKLVYILGRNQRKYYLLGVYTKRLYLFMWKLRKLGTEKKVWEKLVEMGVARKEVLTRSGCGDRSPLPDGNVGVEGGVDQPLPSFPLLEPRWHWAFLRPVCVFKTISVLWKMWCTCLSWGTMFFSVGDKFLWEGSHHFYFRRIE